jgi:hypothetical protein
MPAVAATIAVLLAAFVAVLAVPVVLVIDARRVETLEARWRVRWFFGLVDVRIARGQSRAAARDDARKRSSTGRKRRGRRRHMAFAVMRTRGLLHRVGRLLTAALRQVTLERFHLEMMFGLESPADTGFVYGCLSPLLVMADIRGLDVHCHPMFLESGVRGVFQATIRLRPLPVIGTIVAFLLSPPVFRAAAAAWRSRK